MNIKQIENILLVGGIEPNEAKIEAKMLVKHFAGLSDIDLMLKDEFEMNTKLLEAAQLRAAKRVPIQHIIGTAYFMGEDFIVNETVLIPRDETELLVRKTVEIIERKRTNLPSLHPSNTLVLDIGTGSGCIACMVAKLSSVQVIGLDISTDALRVALENATKLNLNNKAIFRKSDVFSNVREGEKFDVIVSNPPYIPPSEKAAIQKEVSFDPKLALYTTDEEGIEFYKKITEGAPKVLNNGGYLIFELGIGQAQKVHELMDLNGFVDIEIQKDLAGIERVISGRLAVVD